MRLELKLKLSHNKVPTNLHIYTYICIYRYIISYISRIFSVDIIKRPHISKASKSYLHPLEYQKKTGKKILHPPNTTLHPKSLSLYLKSTYYTIKHYNQIKIIKTVVTFLHFSKRNVLSETAKTFRNIKMTRAH